GGSHPLHHHVADGGDVGSGFRFVTQINLDGRQLNAADLNVADEYILHDAAAHGIRFHPQPAFQLRAVEFAPFCINVSSAAGDLAADGDAPVAGFHLTSPNDHVLDRNVDAAAVSVASGFQRDAIVASVEHAILDQYVAA